MNRRDSLIGLVAAPIVAFLGKKQQPQSSEQGFDPAKIKAERSRGQHDSKNCYWEQQRMIDELHEELYANGPIG